MFLIIHSSLASFPIKLPSDTFLYFDVANIYSLKNTGNYFFDSNPEEYWLDEISKEINNQFANDIEAIIIDKNLGGDGWRRAIYLAGHIRLSNFNHLALNQKPIILTDWRQLNIEDKTLKNLSIKDFFQTEGFYFRKYEELFSFGKNITGETTCLIQDTLSNFKSGNPQNIKVIQTDSFHQATNEWGALRLACNFGISLADLTFSYPKHLYFKSLLKNLDETPKPFNSNMHGMFKEILLIDDNAKNGWEQVLSKIFNSNIHSHSKNEETHATINANPAKLKSYDLILLDLYLDKSKEDKSESIRLLDLLKRRHPQVPIVVFTASNKAWNLDQVLEHGADAMYIKESPEYFQNQNYSAENFNDFVKTFTDVYNKYKILSPYWNIIEKIILNSNFQNIENSSRKIKDRIKERLLMFYGLLKKGYEQWDYDKATFFYSDYELAFMTLWSLLNEIQEYAYQKSQEAIIVRDSNGNIFSSHPNGTPLTYLNFKYTKHFKWVIDSKAFIEYSYNFKIDPQSLNPSVDPNGFYLLASSQFSPIKKDDRSQTFVLQPNSITKVNYEDILQIQIAGILLLSSAFSSSIKINSYLKDLYKLNVVRNHLYLTHGNDVGGYFAQTEQSKRLSTGYNIKPTVNANGDIEVLMNLVAFLLTKDDSINIQR